MKKIILIGLLIVMLFTMVGCGQSDENSKYVQDTNTKLVNISGILSYDIDTKIVYYYFKDDSGIGNCSVGYGFMSPYLSEDGRFCRYNLNERKIEEIK